MRHCYSCKTILHPVISGDEEDSVQLDDALQISFHGGYGMYIESGDMLDIPENLKPEKWDCAATLSLFLCQLCVDEIRQKIPWLDDLFEEIMF